MNIDKKTLIAFTAGVLALGGVASVGIQTFAQSTSSSSSAPTSIIGKVMNPVAVADKEEDDNVALPARGISEAAARAAVMLKYPALTIKHIRLENNEGAIGYSAQLSDGSEVVVNVLTGAVALEPADNETSDGKNEGTEAPGTEVNDGPNISTDAADTGTAEAPDTETNDGPTGPSDAGTTTAQ